MARSPGDGNYVKAPAGLTDTHSRKLWLDAQRALREQGTWANTDAPLLEAYVRSVLLARRAREAAGAEPFVSGSRGQLVPHPGLKVAADAEAAACRAAGALLLTPEARKRHDLAPAPLSLLVGLTRPTEVRASTHAEDQRSEGEVPA